MTKEQRTGLPPQRGINPVNRVVFGEAFPEVEPTELDMVTATSFTLPERPDYTVVLTRGNAKDSHKVTCTVYQRTGTDPETNTPTMAKIHEQTGIDHKSPLHVEDPRITEMPFHKEVVAGIRAAIDAKNSGVQKVMAPNATLPAQNHHRT